MLNDNLRLFPVSQLTFIHLLMYSTSFARFLLLFLLLLCSRPAANTRQAAAAATEAQTSCKRTIKKKNSVKWNWKWRQKLPNINDILPFDGILQSTHTIMIIMMRKGESERKEVGKVKIFGRWRRTRSIVLSSIKIIKEPSELGDLAAMRSVTLRNGEAELDEEKWREEWRRGRASSWWPKLIQIMLSKGLLELQMTIELKSWKRSKQQRRSRAEQEAKLKTTVNRLWLSN